MNKIYRKVWNRSLGHWVVASELASGDSAGAVAAGQGVRRSLLAACVLGLLGLSGVAWAADAVCVDPATGLPVGTASGASNEVACGQGAAAGGDESIAIGDSALASGTVSIAVGSGAIASGDASMALGYRAQATGNGANAIGHQAAATGTYSVATGYLATASGYRTVAIGDAAEATNSYDVAIGPTAEASGSHSTAVGEWARARGLNATAIGSRSLATGLNSTAFGYGAYSTTSYGVALGSYSLAGMPAVGVSGTTLNGVVYTYAGSTSLGTVSVGGGDNDFNGIVDTRQIQNVSAGQVSATSTDAINGSQLYATNQAVEALAAEQTHYYSVNDNGVVQGNYSNDGATGVDALAAGTNASAVGEGTVAVGNGATAGDGINPWSGAVAVGNGAVASHQSTVALGDGAIASNLAAVAVGRRTLAEGGNSTAIGDNAAAPGFGGTAVGFESDAIGNYSAAFGGGAQAAGGHGTAVGNSAAASGEWATAVGAWSQAQGDNSVALGGAGDGDQPTAAIADGSVALGASSIADTVAGMAGYDPVAGLPSTDTSPTWLSTRGAVSVGDASNGITRQITDVAAGTEATDAVNVAQLKAAQAEATTHYYSVNDGGVVQGNYNNDGATGANSTAAGINAVTTAAADYGVAIGSNTLADGIRAVAMGDQASAIGTNSAALGAGSYAFGTGTTALNGSRAVGDYATALGQGAQANGTLSTSVGTMAGNGSATGVVNTMIGYSAGRGSNGSNNFYGGHGSGWNTSGSYNVALGPLAAAYAAGALGNAVAVGQYALLGGQGIGNTALGTQAGRNTNGNYNVAIGQLAGFGTIASDTVAIGTSALAAQDRAIAIGTGAQALGSQSISIGTGNVVSGANSAAIGDPNTVSGTGSYVLGNNNTVATNDTFVIGSNVTQTLDNSVALGANTAMEGALTAETAGLTAYNSATINGVTYNYAGGTPVGVVSVGAPGAERRIQNVATGLISATSTDAINGSQLYAGLAGAQTHYYSVNDNGTIQPNYNNDGATGANSLAAGAGTAATATDAVAVGGGAKAANDQDVSIGAYAGFEDAGNAPGDNTAVGFEAGLGSVGSANTAIGAQALRGITGDRNIGLGTNAGAFTTGMENTWIGGNAGEGAQGDYNIAIGTAAGQSIVANETVSLGHRASAQVDDAVALGSYSVSSTAAGVAGYDPITGLLSTDTSPTWVSTRGAVSVGDAANGVTRQITNVAAGTQDTDAVNVAQLKHIISGVSQSHYYSVNDNGVLQGNYANDGATGTNAMAAGPNATASAANGVALGNGASASTANSVALGAGATTGAVVGTASGTIAGTTYTYAGSAPVGTVSIGSAGAERTITHVAAGRVSADSTDAVNGSQLYATHQAIEAVDQRVINIEGDIVDFGDRVTNVEGDIVDLGDRVTNVEGDIANLTTTVNQFDNRVSNVENGADGMFQVSQEGPIAKPAPTGTNSAAGGNGAAASGANALAVGNQSTASGDNSTAIGQGATASHDNSVALGQGSATTVGAQQNYEAAYVGNSSSTGEVNVGGRTIGGVAPGVAGTDAVNVDQLDSGVNYAITEANNYTNTVFNNFAGDVWHRIDGLERDINSGIATAMSLKQAPYVAGKTTYYAGVGAYKGQGAVGISLRRTADNGRWSLESGFSTNRDGSGVYVGISGVLGGD